MTSKINLLITGATGFVGRELVRTLLLTKKFNIKITKRSDKIFFKKNVAEFNFGNLENFVDKKNILSNETRISHICGLPLVSHYKKKLIPLFTPHFDLEGLEGPNYFSYFMVNFVQFSRKSLCRNIVNRINCR